MWEDYDIDYWDRFIIWYLKTIKLKGYYFDSEDLFQDGRIVVMKELKIGKRKTISKSNIKKRIRQTVMRKINKENNQKKYIQNKKSNIRRNLEGRKLF